VEAYDRKSKSHLVSHLVSHLHSNLCCCYSYLGPAEVAAWALLGTIWEALELYTEAIANAAEVRCAFLLGAGRPMQAKMSAYKSILIGFVTSVLLTGVVFIAGDDLPRWLTKDPVLQKLVADLIPIFGVGNIALTLGNMAWTLVGAQGRIRLSTTVGFLGSWMVTTPLAALSCLVFRFDLTAMTATVVLGYMMSGSCNTYVLLRSDWEDLSLRVIEDNGGEIVDEDADDDSSSSSSSGGGGSGSGGGGFDDGYSSSSEDEIEIKASARVDEDAAVPDVTGVANP
jgi:uncharacterized membrane protein YgcG